MVYEKSISGLQEISHPERKLNARQRQVLILIDGKRTQDDLGKYLNKLKVAEIIGDLERLGYIRDSKKPKYSIDLQKDESVSPDLSPEKIETIQNIMIESTNESLGLMGRSVVEKIRAANDYDQLKSCISLWNMALRESKRGHAAANELMRQVQEMLSASA